jgi:hypothetical protein
MRTSITQNERRDYGFVLRAIGDKTSILPDSLGTWPNAYHSRIISRILANIASSYNAFTLPSIFSIYPHVKNMIDILRGRANMGTESNMMNYIFDGNMKNGITIADVYQEMKPPCFSYFMFFPSSIMNLKGQGVDDHTINLLKETASRSDPMYITMIGDGLSALDIMYIMRGMTDKELSYMEHVFSRRFLISWNTSLTTVMSDIHEHHLMDMDKSKPAEIIDSYHERMERGDNVSDVLSWLNTNLHRDDIHEEAYLVEAMHRLHSMAHNDSDFLKGLQHCPDIMDYIVDMPEEFVIESVLGLAGKN